MVVSNVRFVAITNDVLDDVGKHYITVWMRGDATGDNITINDGVEIADAGWFAAEECPHPIHRYFENLVCGRSMPGDPDELPETLRRLGALVQIRSNPSSERP